MHLVGLLIYTYARIYLHCHFSDRVSQSYIWYGEVKIGEAHVWHFLSVVGWPLLPNRCRCRGFLLHLITLSDTHTHTLTGGLLWTKDRPVRETCTWQHTTFITGRLPCLRWNSNPRSQQASGRRTTPSRGHWDRRLCLLTFVFLLSWVMGSLFI